MALVDNVLYASFGNGSSTGYYAVTQWAAATAKVCGNIVRQLAAPAVGNERCFACIASAGGTGQTGGAEPTWTVTRGAKITDNNLTWQECTGLAALNGDLVNTPTWNTIKGTVVTQGQVIQNNAGTLILIASVGGTAGGGAEPSWAAFTNAGATTADNTVTWVTLGASFAAWAAPHARFNSANATNWAQAGSRIFLADNSAETQATGITLNAIGTSPAPVRVYSVDHTAAVPPTAPLTGASISATGASNILFTGFYYFNGITFSTGNAANAGSIGFSNTGAGVSVLENCALVLNNTNAGAVIRVGQNSGSTTRWKTKLINTRMKFGAAGQQVNLCGSALLEWMNTANAVDSAGVAPTTLFTFGLSGFPTLMAVLRGVDLSFMGSGKTIFGDSTVSPFKGFLIECKLGASVTICTTPSASNAAVIDVLNSDSGATGYRQERYAYEATKTTETSITRQGGASDGVTSISHKIVSTGNVSLTNPFEDIPLGTWNNVVGQPITLTVEGTINSAALPNNDEIWIEAMYGGSSGSPLAAFANSYKASDLAAGAAYSASGSPWNGGGSGAGWSPFSMPVTFTPQMAGYITVTVKVAKPSTTYYIDPKVRA